MAEHNYNKKKNLNFLFLSILNQMLYPDITSIFKIVSHAHDNMEISLYVKKNYIMLRTVN